MTRTEYEEYEAKLAEFFSHGLQNLSHRLNPNRTEEPIEPYFSWSPCCVCGCSLGGDRYDCDGYNSITKEIEQYNCVCVDCAYYAEYGCLDDSTMMEIEENG